MKKGEKKEPKERISKPKSILPGAIALGLLAAGTIFAVMLNAEKNALASYEKGIILAAVKEIPAGELISEDNYEDYFQEKEVDKKLISATALTAPEQVYGLVPEVSIDAGTLLTGGLFRSIEEISAGMREPVVVGLKAEDLYQVSGGIIRAGDLVQIYMVDEESGETAVLWQDAYVQQVFDSAGNAIASGDTATPAQRLNIYLEKENVEAFYSQLALGSLRVVKIWK